MGIPVPRMTPVPWKSQNTQQSSTGSTGRSPTLLAGGGQEFLGFPTPLPASWQPNRNGTGHWLRVSEAGTSKDPAGPGWPRGVLRVHHSGTQNPDDEFPSLLFWGRNQLKILICQLGRREINGRGWTWPGTPWAVSLLTWFGCWMLPGCVGGVGVRSGGPRERIPLRIHLWNTSGSY